MSKAILLCQDNLVAVLVTCGTLAYQLFARHITGAAPT
jgi:hypothetical protein